jgi:hypothetical protein
MQLAFAQSREQKVEAVAEEPSLEVSPQKSMFRQVDAEKFRELAEGPFSSILQLCCIAQLSSAQTLQQ